MSDFSSAVREHVRQLIFDSGLSQHAFAKELGRSQSSISQLLTGNRHGKDLDVWKEIAGYFGRSLSQLIADVELRHLQQKLTSASPAQLAAVREDLHADITARRKQLHQSQDVIEDATVMPASITAAPIPAGELDGDRRPLPRPSDLGTVFAFEYKSSPTLSRVLLQQDIETLVQTEWRKRNHVKLQRLFESIASRIELIAKPGDEHPIIDARDSAAPQALDARAAADLPSASAPRRSSAQSRPPRKPRPKSRQLRQRA